VEDCQRAGHRLLIDDFVFLELTGWGSRAELGEKSLVGWVGHMLGCCL
jgi:hypothetical protein